MTVGYFRFYTAILAVLASSACSDDNDNKSRPAPTLSGLTLTGVRPAPLAGAPEYDPTAPLVLPCDGSLVAFVEVSEFEIRRAGECGNALRCGHVFVRATGPAGQKEVRSATRSVFIPLTEQRDTSSPAAAVDGWVGSVAFDAELSRDDGSPFLNPDGAPVRASLTVDLSAPTGCDRLSGDGGAPSE